MLFWLLLCGLLTTFISIASWKGPQMALGIVIPASWLLPVWIILPFGSLPNETLYGSGVDLKTAAASICLLLYCFMPGRTFPIRLVPLDGAVAALIAIHAIVDTSRDGLSWMMLARMYAEWYLPYIAGRLAFQSRADLPAIWISGCIIAFAFALISSIEAFFRINLLELIAGARPLEGFSLSASRWDLKRAYGPNMHPIYFGVLQLMVAAMCTIGTYEALSRRCHPLWLFAPLVPAIGIACTGSRGPIAAIPVAILMGVFVAHQRSRIPLLVVSGLLVILGIANREAIIRQLEVWSGEAKRPKLEELQIGEETVVHSGTRNRVNLIEVYKIALSRSGLLGFGTKAVTGFPVNVPVGPRELRTIQRTRYIDNTYVLLTLRFGYLGVGTFGLCCVMAIVQFIFVADRTPSTLVRRFAITLAASLGGTLAVLLTVWMPPDFGFAMVWTFGASSGLVLVNNNLARATKEATSS